MSTLQFEVAGTTYSLEYSKQASIIRITYTQSIADDSWHLRVSSEDNVGDVWDFVTIPLAHAKFDDVKAAVSAELKKLWLDALTNQD